MMHRIAVGRSVDYLQRASRKYETRIWFAVQNLTGVVLTPRFAYAITEVNGKVYAYRCLDPRRSVC